MPIWFNKLEDVRAFSNFQNSLIVAQELERGRRFTVFNSYLEFKDIRDTTRNFHEIVQDGPQKMRFDIDLKRNGERNSTQEEFFMMEDGDLIPASKTVLESYYTEASGDQIVRDTIHTTIQCLRNAVAPRSISVQDFLIFSSHGENKLSYHIVLDNFYFRSNIECGELFKKVVQMRPNLKRVLDPQVYSKNQSFRIEGCTKFGEERYKTWRMIEGQIVEEFGKTLILGELGVKSNIILAHSLLGYTIGCHLVRGFEKQEEAPKQWKELENIPGHVMSRIQYILGDNFAISEVRGSLIVLTRLRPWLCEICDRVHDNSSPYLTINRVGSSCSVWFHCRRSGTKMSLFDDECSDESESESEDELPWFLSEMRSIPIRKGGTAPNPSLVYAEGRSYRRSDRSIGNALLRRQASKMSDK